MLILTDFKLGPVFVMAIAGRRSERTEVDSLSVDNDVMRLHSASKQWLVLNPHKADVFIEVLVQSPDLHLREV